MYDFLLHVGLAEIKWQKVFTSTTILNLTILHIFWFHHSHVTLESLRYHNTLVSKSFTSTTCDARHTLCQYTWYTATKLVLRLNWSTNSSNKMSWIWSEMLGQTRKSGVIFVYGLRQSEEFYPPVPKFAT